MATDDGPNMELRALVAVALSLLVLVISQFFFGPQPPELLEPPAPPAEQAGVPEQSTPTPQPTAPGPEGAAAQPAGAAVEEPPRAAAADVEEEVIVDTPTLRARLTNRGARIASLILKDYRADPGANGEAGGEQLELVRRDFAAADELPLALLTPIAPEVAAAANGALFVTEVEGGRQRGSEWRAEGSPVEVRWLWAAGGRVVEKRLVFPSDGYLLKLELSDSSAAETPTFLSWGPGLVDGEDTSTTSFYLTRGGISYSGGDLDHWTYDDLTEPAVVDGTIWGGVEASYFAALFVPDRPARLRLSAEPLPERVIAPVPREGEDGASAEPGVLAAVQLQAGRLAIDIYTGPKQYDLLAGYGHDLQRAVDFGLWGFLAYPLLVGLNWLNGYVGNYGVAIILLTVLLKVLFLPLTHNSMKSMRKMQQLQPEMQAIRARYKGVKDMQKRQEMNTEVMELYKKHGVSPLGGCLPLLLQMPVLFAFYACLSLAIEIRQAPFMLWITDLSKADPWLVLPILMGASMYWQQRMSPSSPDPVQARIFRLMPVMFTFLFLRLPSGLVLYWLVNNLLGIAQQTLVNRQMAEAASIPPAARSGQEKKGKKGKGGKRKKRGKR